PQAEDGHRFGRLDRRPGLWQVLFSDQRDRARALDRLQGKRGLDGDDVRRRNPCQQLAELELVEYGPGPVGVVSQPAGSVKVERDRDVGLDCDHALAQPDLVGAGCQRGPDPALLELVEIVQHVLDRAELLDELRGRLVPYSRYSRNVVRGVAPQRLVLDQLAGLESVPLPDLIWPVDHGVGDTSTWD